MSVHFLWSLFYLGLTILLVFCYFLVPFCIFLICRWFVRLAKDKNHTITPIASKKALLFSLLFLVGLVVLNGLFYKTQRTEYMGEDNANLTAKEYWVAGQVLNMYRLGITTFVHPDSWYLAPLHALQQRIYDHGKNYLPENDAEIGVWTDIWFVYPYSRNFKVSSDMIPLLDKAWFALETIATRPMADRQMYEEQYLRNYAGMAHYYAFENAYYTGGKWGHMIK